MLAPTVTMGPAYTPRRNLPTFQSHVKEEGGVEGEIERSELSMTMGSSVLHQLSFPMVAKPHHTLWAERPLILRGPFILLIWYIVPSGYQDGPYLDKADVLKQNQKDRRYIRVLNPECLKSGLLFRFDID